MEDKPYQSKLIQKAQWDEAKWEGTSYLIGKLDELPPMLGLMFMDLTAGNRIFEDWIKIIGSEDHYEELRVSIIEGDIPNQKPGYSMVIGSNIEGEIAHAKKKGLVMEPRYVSGVSRVLRNPNPDSPHLANFKLSYQKHNKYFLIPVYSPDLKQMNPQINLRILKKEIFFRRIEEISETDIDSVVFSHSFLSSNKN